MTVGRIMIMTVVLVLVATWAYAADCNNGGRYEYMGDGTVTDCRTGTIWLKDAMCTDPSGGIVNPTGHLTWYDAMKWVAGLHDGLCGLTDGSSAGDWRLPTITEWMAMVAYAKKIWTNPALSNGAGTGQWTDGDVFNNVQSYDYWSSTTHALNEIYAYDLHMSNGFATGYIKVTEISVWSVRGGQSGSFGTLFIE